MSGAVSPDMQHFAFLRIARTVPEVVGTENGTTFSLPLLLDSSSLASE